MSNVQPLWVGELDNQHMDSIPMIESCNNGCHDVYAILLI